MKKTLLVCLVLALPALAQIQRPNAGDVLTWNGNAWLPTAPVASGGSGISTYTVAALPASPAANTVAQVTDGATASDCSTGLGSVIHLCTFNGGSWVITAGPVTTTSVGQANRAATVTSTLTTNDQLVLASCASLCTFTLPSASAACVSNVCQVISIKDAAGTANTVNITVAPPSGTLDGAASLKITANYGFLKVTSNRTNWYTVP